MKRLFLLLLPLLALAACDTSDNSLRYQLSLFDQDEARVMDLEIVTPNRSSCLGLGCGAGNAMWTASNLDAEFTLEQTRGTLYAVVTGTGTLQLALTPEAPGGGVTVEIDQDPSGMVTGEWASGRVEGDTLTAESSLRGLVEGIVE